MLREVLPLRPYFSRSRRLALLVTDPDGAPSLNAGAFADFHQLTLELKRLNDQRPAFLVAMRLRSRNGSLQHGHQTRDNGSSIINCFAATLFLTIPPSGGDVRDIIDPDLQPIGPYVHEAVYPGFGEKGKEN